MLHSHAAVVFIASGCLAVAASLAVGCSTANPPPDEIIATPATPVTQGATNPNPTPVGALPVGACDDFGTLNAPSLTGRLDNIDGTDRQAVTLTVSNRPAVTKATIIVNGDPSSLVGATVALGTGANGNAFTCTHCVVVAVGCSSTGCGQAALFFPRAGSATLSAVASATGQPFDGTLTDVELGQVTLDGVAGTMTPVPGGACLRIPRLTFAATMTSSITTPPSDAGGPLDDGGSGAADSGSGTPVDGGAIGGDKSGGIGMGTHSTDAGEPIVDTLFPF